MSEEKQTLANLLHTVFCNRPHSEDMIELVKGRKEGFCYFYLEHTLTDCWELDDHKYWTMFIDILFDLIPLNDRREFLDKLLKFCMSFIEMAEYGEGVQLLIYNLLYRGEEDGKI